MKKYLFVLWYLLAFSAAAQQVVVPNNVYFADIHLKIDESGRREIQRMVDALHRHPTYFQMKVDRTDTYFPIIERVFKEEGLPEDFKYLALQESGLVSDAVSTSNAVGYWQFKKEAASDYGLRMNQHVDERKHIIESSRGAARYLVRNNNYYQNWVNTLLSYNLGLTGAKGYARPSDAGARRMEITGSTHHYILTFLAHKIAFENAVGKKEKPLVYLQELPARPGQSLSDIALATQIDPLELEKYNKWLSSSTVPGDKSYTVMVPVINEEQEQLLASSQSGGAGEVTMGTKAGNRRVAVARTKVTRLNDLKVVVAGKGETKEKMARRGRMSISKFLRINEMSGNDRIVEGETYYLQRKRNWSSVDNHVVQPGESVSSISRKYGIKEKAIRSKNRMSHNEPLEPGRVLWLSQTRPRFTPVEFQKTAPADTPTTTPTVTAPEPAPRQRVPQQATPAPDPVEKEKRPRRRINWTGQETPAEPATPVAVPKQTEATFPTAPEKPKTVPTTVTPEPQQATRPAPTPAPEPKAPAPATPAEAPTEVEEQEDVQDEPWLNTPLDQEEPTEVATPAPTQPAPAIVQPDSTATKETKTTIRWTDEPAATPQPKEKVSQPNERVATPAPAPAAKPAPSTVTKPAAPAPAAEPAPQPRQNASGTHVVAKGETLYAIARQYQLAVVDLKTWNSLGDKLIQVGQELVVVAPVAAPAATAAAAEAAPSKASPTGTVVHTVGQGETIYQISRKYNVTIKEVMDWNKKSDFNVSIGEKLVIKAR